MENSVKTMIKELVSLSEEQWGGYAFYHEPLERKFDETQKKEYIAKACACGREEARMIKEEYPGVSVRQILEKMGFAVKTPDVPTGGGHVIFAQYIEPAEVVVYRDCVEKAEALIEKEDLACCLGDLNIEELLLAHELFHGIEYRKRKSIYTQTEKIELWRRPFSNKSRILCLSEMAAMAFAGEMLGLSYSPYVMDVLLMYSYNDEAAQALYEEILEAAGIKERKEEC